MGDFENSGMEQNCNTAAELQHSPCTRSRWSGTPRLVQASRHIHAQRTTQFELKLVRVIREGGATCQTPNHLTSGRMMLRNALRLIPDRTNWNCSARKPNG